MHGQQAPTKQPQAQHVVTKLMLHLSIGYHSHPAAGMFYAQTPICINVIYKQFRIKHANKIEHFKRNHRTAGNQHF